MSKAEKAKNFSFAYYAIVKCSVRLKMQQKYFCLGSAQDPALEGLRYSLGFPVGFRHHPIRRLRRLVFDATGKEYISMVSCNINIKKLSCACAISSINCNEDSGISGAGRLSSVPLES